MSQSRTRRARIAEETLSILETGGYRREDGEAVDLADVLRACIEGTRHFREDQIHALRAQGPTRGGGFPTRFVLRNETTLQGLATMRPTPEAPVAVLNFASAKNPGGGFLGGSQAQEESLARSSGLYASLRTVPDFYASHRSSPSLLYSDAMIHSPHCPVFRDDEGHLSPSPHLAGFITCAAPNAGAIAVNRPDESPLVASTLRLRAEGILALACALGYTRLLLGAWGCGVFRNDPVQVADAFAGPLRGGAYAGAFEDVRFSVLDSSPASEIFGAFRDAFAA